MLLINIAKYTGFCVYRRSYLIPGMAPRDSVPCEVSIGIDFPSEVRDSNTSYG